MDFIRRGEDERHGRFLYSTSYHSCSRLKSLSKNWYANMELSDTRKNWNRFGKKDPLYAILGKKDKSGSRWNIAEFFKTGEKEIADVLAYIASKNITFKHGRALDFGCAIGRLSQALALHFEEVNGVDIAPSMIKLARAHNRYRDTCKYFLNQKDDLKLFPDKHFDFIYSNIVLQHMEPQYAEKY